MQAFAGKAVMVWGCGALGAPVAESVMRAGAARVIVVDSAAVTPGILVRQPFTDADIGKPKAEVLAERLRAIRPGADVTPHVGDIRRLLARDDWHCDADVILDCSANLSVQTKLELVARRRPAATAPTWPACCLVTPLSTGSPRSPARATRELLPTYCARPSSACFAATGAARLCRRVLAENTAD